MIFKRGASSWQGHVAFYVSESATHYTCLGGNQGNRVSISRYPKGNLLGARMPATLASSYKARAGAAGFVSFAASQAEMALPYVEQAAGLPGLANYGAALQAIGLGLGLIAFGYVMYREWKDVGNSKDEALE
jgi:hypothetical protein